jgi:antitoxin VapB
VRIPHEIALEGDEAVLRRDGDRVVVEAAGVRPGENLIEYLRRIPPITDDFPEIDDPLPEDVEI